LRIPYAYLYPCILCFCILGTYSVSNNIVDVWILLSMGAVGYLLRKFGYDLAPVALGLVLAPMLELSLRQSLAMSAGDYAIFIERPIATTMLVLGALLMLYSLKPLIFRGRRDWRSEVGLEKSE
jgi:putative tricarboxylic transport membrane protein